MQLLISIFRALTNFGVFGQVAAKSCRPKFWEVARNDGLCRPEFYHMLNNILSSLLHNYPHHHLKNEIYYKHFWFIFTSLCSTRDKISGDIAQHFGREDLRATWPVTISDILYYRCFFALNTDCWNGLLCWPQRGKTIFKFLTFFLAEKTCGWIKSLSL